MLKSEEIAERKREEIIKKLRLDDKFFEKFLPMSLEDILYLKLYDSIPKFPVRFHCLEIENIILKTTKEVLDNIVNEIYPKHEQEKINKRKFFLAPEAWAKILAYKRKKIEDSQDESNIPAAK